MPATVNSSVGSLGMSDAEGTWVWSRSTKKHGEGATQVLGVHDEPSLAGGTGGRIRPPAAGVGLAGARLAARPGWRRLGDGPDGAEAAGRAPIADARESAAGAASTAAGSTAVPPGRVGGRGGSQAVRPRPGAGAGALGGPAGGAGVDAGGPDPTTGADGPQRLPTCAGRSEAAARRAVRLAHHGPPARGRHRQHPPQPWHHHRSCPRTGAGRWRGPTP